MSIDKLCGLFGKTKQAFYKRNKAQPSNELDDIAARVVDFVNAERVIAPRIGGRKLCAMFNSRNTSSQKVGRDRFFDILREHDLLVSSVKRRTRTTNSNHNNPVYPDLRRDFIPDAPNQLWVSDMTYIQLIRKGGHLSFCYLSLVTDAYTREILGWSLQPTLDTDGPMEAIKQAMSKFSVRDRKNLIHHSDRGCQYASKIYTRYLQQRGVQISMTESSDPRDNAQAERVNGILKNEFLSAFHYESLEAVLPVLFRSIDYYNKRRPHLSLGMLTPFEARKCRGELKSCWRSLRKEALAQKKRESAAAASSVAGSVVAFGLRPSSPPEPATEEDLEK